MDALVNNTTTKHSEVTMNSGSVKWLVKELNQKIDFIPMNKWDEIKEVIKQAKEMEKANILRAAKRGYLAIAEKFDLDEAQNYANEYYANCYK